MKRSLIFSLIFFTGLAYSQERDPAHPELNWFTIETEHFFVHYHDGAEWTARMSAKIAEQIYHPITTLYKHEPDQKVSIVIRDHDDYSNGAAYFYDNRIEIWAPSMDFELRGIHPWLWNVITHEFTHIVQIQTVMKLGRSIPAIYLQWFGYESERRPDVLYGFPNTLVSYPLSGFVVPGWFAEGVAQFNIPELKYDFWDSHRDMILRMYMLDGNPLSWEEMAVFGKNSLGNESSYNAGFSIVSFISEEYGVEKLVEISRALSNVPTLTIDAAIEKVLGIRGIDLFNKWKASTSEKYRDLLKIGGPVWTNGRIVEGEGFGNFYPSFTPDGKSVAFISNKGKDFFSQSSLYLSDLKSGKTVKLFDGIRSTYSFSSEGRYIYYSKVTSENPFRSKFSDVFRFDRDSKEHERITHELRAENPRLSPDGQKILFTVNKDGTRNIAISDLDGNNIEHITRYPQGTQVYTPVWSPDGKYICFGYSIDHGQEIVLFDYEQRTMKVLPFPKDSRNPIFSSDGRKIFFSSDMTGIFNIYSFDLVTSDLRRHTNVKGGAFLPNLRDDGSIVCVTYTSSGYKVVFLPTDSLLDLAVSMEDLATARTVFANGMELHLDSSQLSLSADLKESSVSSTRYRNTFTSLNIVPILRLDNYNPRNRGIDVLKAGIYFSSYEVLDKIQLYGMAAINKKFERDLYVGLEYRDRLPGFFQLGLDPTLTVEGYSLSRTTDFSFNLFVDQERTFDVDVTFNLLALDATLKHSFFSEMNEIALRYSYQRYIQDFGGWFHPTFGNIQSSRAIYLIGNSFTFSLRHNGIVPGVDKDIAPVGRSLMFRGGYELNQFNPEDDFKIENGFRVPLYTNYNYPRVEFSWTENWSLPIRHHTFSLSLRGGSILGPSVDDFFDFYVGGFAGMKGYPFYSLGGNETMTLHAAYRFPISRSMDTRFLQFYFKKLYGSVFGDFGNAWTGSTPPLKSWKKDIGLELRLEAFSFYSYPTRFFLSGAYGFDEFDKVINNNSITYGREWHFYLGILFDFEIRELSKFRIR